MTIQGFFITFGSFAGTALILYAIGHVFTIEPLMLQHTYTEQPTGFLVTTGSLLPLMLALPVSFLAEQLYKRRRA